MTSVNWRTIGAIFIIVAMALAGPATAAEPIRIGVVGPLSGPAANSGIAMKKAFQYVVDKANQGGGVQLDDGKRKIELLFEDDQSQPARGVSATTKLLTRDNVDILLGDMFHSSVTLAIMDLVPSFPDTFFMSGQPVSIEIAERIKEEPKKYHNFWKGLFNTDAYAKTVWQTIHSLIQQDKFDPGDKRIAFIAQDDDYGRSNIEYVRNDFLGHGWEEVMFSAVPLGHADFYPQITKLKATPPDLLVSVFSVVNSGMALVKQLEEKQLNIPHMAIYYPLRPEFHDGVPAQARNGLMWLPLFFDPAHNEQQAAFSRAFEKATGIEPNGDHAMAVCMMGTLIANIEQAGTVDVDPLVNAFKTNAHECVLGAWDYNTENHTPKFGPDAIPIPAAQIQDGESYVIWPENIATSQYRNTSK